MALTFLTERSAACRVSDACLRRSWQRAGLMWLDSAALSKTEYSVSSKMLESWTVARIRSKKAKQGSANYPQSSRYPSHGAALYLDMTKSKTTCPSTFFPPFVRPPLCYLLCVVTSLLLHPVAIAHSITLCCISATPPFTISQVLPPSVASSRICIPPRSSPDLLRL